MRDLNKVEPQLKDAVERILTAMNALGYPMMVTDTLRTQEEQMKLYAKGRSTPGPIVTYVDGVSKKSNHQAKEEGGLGRAVDCCFVVDGHPSWDLRLPWKLYGMMAEILGLKWGGSWKTLVDLPHVELS